MCNEPSMLMLVPMLSAEVANADEGGGEVEVKDEGEEDGDGDDEEVEEKQEGRRRYDLPNRTDVRRFSMDGS